MDPPFTLRADIIKESVLLINSLKKLESNIPMFYFFFFPYDFSEKINEKFVEGDPFKFKMLDYRIEYDYDRRKDGKKIS